MSIDYRQGSEDLDREWNEYISNRSLRSNTSAIEGFTAGWNAAVAHLTKVEASKAAAKVAQVQCSYCGGDVLVPYDGIVHAGGGLIPGNHGGRGDDGYCQPTEVAECPGSGMLGIVVWTTEQE